MKTQVAQSSIATYHDLKAHAFNGQHQAILNKMVAGVIYSRRQLAKMTKLETSAVAGRCNELITEGRIVACGHIHCPITHRQVEGLKLAGQQQELLN